MSLAIRDLTIEEKDKFDFKQNLKYKLNEPAKCKINDDALLKRISDNIQSRMKTKTDLESENIESNMIEETNEMLKIAREVLRQQQRQDNNVDQLLNKYLFQP